MSQTPSLVFRTAEAADLAFIVGLIHHDSVTGSVETPGDMTPYREALAAISRDGNQLLMIAETGGERAGTFQLTFTPGIVRRGGMRCTIEGVHVDPAFRNRGIGAAMMDWAVEQARERGCWVVQLTSNASRGDAHRFYERLGFSPSHQGFKLMLR